MTPADQALAAPLMFAFGLVLGSFLNVCIYRLPRRESVVSPGSRCTTCGRALRWNENIPVISYVTLGGRCRRCRERISVMYPIVEITTATIFLLHYLIIGPQPLLISRLVFAGAMIVLFVIDLQHRILPNIITIPGVFVGFLFSLFLPPGWVSSAIGIGVGGGILLVIAEAYYRVRHEEGLGMGDVKMLAMIGAFLGWQLTLLTLVMSSFIGSVVGVVMIVSGKGDMKYALPFGTFLALAAIVAGLGGEEIIAWYLGFYS